MEKLRVQSFTDYRSFLLAHVQDKRRANPSWTYGMWARSLGLKDTSSITKIIQGQRHPGAEMTEKLIKYFALSERDAQYFGDLVQFQKVKNDPRLSVLLLQKLGRHNRDHTRLTLDDKTFALISQWYCLAIREMVRLKDFFEDPEWVAKQFNFAVTPKEAQRALQLLEEAGLLERKRGRLHVRESMFETTNDFSSEAIKRYHEATLENARAAVRKFGVDEREITSMVLAMPSRRLGEAKALIRDFKQKFESLLEEDGSDSVYQLQIQYYPLTKRKK